jgi:hypothetical protein
MTVFSGEEAIVTFLRIGDRLVEFWASADEYWDAVDGDLPRPH